MILYEPWEGNPYCDTMYKPTRLWSSEDQRVVVDGDLRKCRGWQEGDRLDKVGEPYTELHE